MPRQAGKAGSNHARRGERVEQHVYATARGHHSHGVAESSGARVRGASQA